MRAQQYGFIVIVIDICRDPRKVP